MLLIRILILLLIAAISGCLSSDQLIEVQVKDKESGRPLEGVLVERICPPSLFEKIFSPIRSTYLHDGLAESVYTNATGRVSLRELNSQDRLRIYPKNARSLLISAWGKETSLSPEANQPDVTKWYYSVWLRDGMIEWAGWPEKDDPSDAVDKPTQ